jgi:hypothetical protein
LWNTFSFGTVNTTAPDQFKINVGVYNPILGKGYGEMAAESRSNHKTQGFGSARQRGDVYEYFKTILGDAPKDDLMDGVNTTWARIGNQAIGNDIEAINKSFDVDHPDKSVSKLVDLLGQVENIQNTYWRDQKTKELSDLIVACAGLWAEAYAPDLSYAVGDSIPIKAQVISRYNNEVKLNSILSRKGFEELYGLMIRQTSPPTKEEFERLYPFEFSKETTLSANQLQTFDLKAIADNITQPYWLKTAHGIGDYNIKEQTDVGNPENRDLQIVRFNFIIEGKLITFDRRLVYKYVDPAKGEIYQPVQIAPPVTANLQSQVYIFNSQQPQTVQVKLKSFKNAATGNIRLNVPEGWKVSPENATFNSKAKGDEWEQDFTVTPSGNQSQTGVLEAQVTLGMDPKVYNYSILSIHYEHIPNITIFPPAQAKLLQLDLKIAGKKIGYIDGAGDLVKDALRQVGYEVHDLTENEILNGDLSGYDAIIVGVRAYNINTRLAIEQPKLMEYVKNGGNLLVQYNNNGGLVTKEIGPYPFKVVNERVTDENAKITIIDPNNPVLNYPNKINQSDFDGWVQERGLYFTKDADPQYQKVLQMNDPGEAPKDGALITTQYGKGRFVYTSLSFFRQLPAGVPGAYRLFINLLNKPKTNP